MTPEQLRRLADLVADLGMDGYQVTDAELLERRDDPVVAAVEMSLPESDEEATSASAGASPVAGAMSVLRDGVPVNDDNDVVDSSEKDGGDEPESEAEDSDGDETVELTDAEQDVVDVLEDEGELSRSEIKLLTGRGGYVHKIIPRLKDEGILEHRKDPEDGRRYLYSLARNDVVDEGTGGGHESPDTSDIGTGEMTSAIRPLDDKEWASVSELEQRDQEGTDMIQTSGFAAEDDESDDDRIHFPWECSCGVVCDSYYQKLIHRTEAHGGPQKDFNFLKQGEFIELVQTADSVKGLADRLDWPTQRLLRVLGFYGLDDAVAGDGLPDNPTTSADLLQLGDEAGSGERRQAETEVSPDA